MLRFQTFRRFQKEEPQPSPTQNEDVKAPETLQTNDVKNDNEEDKDIGSDGSTKPEDEEDPSLRRGDHLNVLFRPYLSKILDKRGDKNIFFADKVLRFTGSGKIKRRILLITDSAVYIVDPDTDKLKRRIALASVEKICLSKLSDNFFAIIIPTEYDLLMASTRKTEIVTSLLDAFKSASAYEPDLFSSNRFEYQAAADLAKEVQFEEVEGR